jgi:drug/metabolite transporter (DMT)-like permease
LSARAALGGRFGAPWLLLSAASLFWALNLVIGRGMRGEIPPVAMSFWRWTIAFAIILPFTAGGLWRERQTIAKHWPVLALLGLVGICLFNTMCYIGLTATTATNATLFNSVVPVFIPPIAWLLIRESTRPRQFAGILLSLLGVVVIVAQGSSEVLRTLQFNRGDLWLLAAMVLWALYTVLLRFRPAHFGMLDFLAVILLFGWPMLLVWYAFELASGLSVQWSPKTATVLAYYGIFPAVLAFVCYNRGVAAIGPTRAGIFVHLVPVFGILLSTLFLGEPPRSYHAIGILLIFSGIALTTWPQAEGRARG